MRKFKIGLLIPYSSTFRNLQEDFMNGLELGMGARFQQVEWVPEFIGSGEFRIVQEKLQKLAQFNRVNAIAGIVNNNVACSTFPTLEQYSVPLLVCNLGACIPDVAFSHPYLLYNSMHLWKSQWVMGQWGQARFGGQPSINLSVYEGGYGMHISFKSGAAAAGAENVTINVLPLRVEETDTAPLVNKLREQMPAHAHVLLSGKEGPQFLQRFRESGLQDSMEISLNPYIVGAEQSPALLEGMYTATTWLDTLPDDANQQFITDYMHRFEERPAPFAVLGYEAGLAFSEAVSQGGVAGLADTLQQVSVSGPRGVTQLSTKPVSTTHPVYVVRSGGDVVATEQGVPWTDTDLAAGAALVVSGWQNPYLCV